MKDLDILNLEHLSCGKLHHLMALHQCSMMTLTRSLVELLDKFDLKLFHHLNYFEFQLQLIHFHLVEALERSKNILRAPAKSSLNSIDIMILFTWVSETKT